MNSSINSGIFRVCFDSAFFTFWQSDFEFFETLKLSFKIKRKSKFSTRLELQKQIILSVVTYRYKCSFQKNEVVGT